jgi:predicted dehydrogenase
MLHVGIIGCGSIARQRHAAEYKRNANTVITGVFDVSRERAEAMAQDFGGKVFDTVEELIADASIDVVSVCVANAYHAPITIDALNHGKHVLCEKPMAITLKDCEEMLAAEQKSGKRLLIDHNQRLTPAHKKAKEIVASGELGRVISFAATFGHKGPEMWSADKSSNTWFFKKNAAAFGSMADLGIHKIDLMRYLIGSDVKNVFSRLATLDKKFPDGTPIEVDDNSVEILTFENGALGTVTTSWTHYGEECNASSLYCEKGTIRLYHDPKYSLQVVYADGTKAHYELDRMQTNDDAQQRTSGVIDVFVDSILTGNKSILDAEDILNSMRVVFACLESAESGRIVEL